MNVAAVPTVSSVEDTNRELDEKVDALRLPATYSQPGVAIESIETHFAWVFLAGDRAYKLKKPAAHPGMDLRTLDCRHASCLEELRLNRKLAPDVYLDVVALIRGRDGRLRLGGEGAIAEWLVQMRRLPSELMLDRALRAGTATARALASVASLLVGFYRAQPKISFAADEYVERIAGQIRDDRHALFAPELRLDDHHVQAALTATWCALAAVERELGARAREAHIVEAHGDLRPEHICLSDPPCVIDALEFSRDLRILDPAEELAYLWIECLQAGAAQPADSVIDAYRRGSGDPVSDRLLDFYRSRRAMVRAKIVAWHLNDPAVMDRGPWRELAEGYLAFAERYARHAVGDDPCPGWVPG
jgi:aminoglycoside phosphotransferase family enzyme